MQTEQEQDKATLLVVDDTPGNLNLMHALLKSRYHVLLASNGEQGMQVARDKQPDLILLDILMPDLDGYEVCKRLKADRLTQDIPIIFLTAKADMWDEQKGLEMGAVDYISKPISSKIVLARVKTQLIVKASADFLRDKNEHLELQVARRTREIQAVQDVAIMAMATLAEMRDCDTSKHILRTQHYVKALAEHLKSHPGFAEQLTDQTIQVIFKSAPLHDIGKVGIPERILLKPGNLTPQEEAIMQTHTTLGRDAIEQAEQSLGLQVEFFSVAKQIALSHQEKWDGSGYPEGLAGDRIPLAARLMAVADVYDDCISPRIYTAGLPHKDAVRKVFEARGSHLDPDMADAFVEIEQTIEAIAKRFADTPEDLQRKMKYMAYAIAEEA
ncbi:MAG: two-component system response regulator [Gammaproteobacteria bacterium]|nr:two-component system response regulator [Gammaproteobacteria bacterium]MBU0785327.1 two-component system response regulator [Gammaproteobacteria bacterium]MBU0815910.1 two-component system response regulator [Gammaproteobacteria bacterium]MBU1787449.1 two-component system response regulator [Gammaproteobacteria bacterium]